MAGKLSALEIMDAPWEWGAADCCTAACDAFAAVHNIDPMRDLRGTYSSAIGAARAIARRGGFAQMCADLAEQSGLCDGCGRAGEIGVAVMPDGTRALVFAVSDGIWAGKTEDGFVTLTAVERSWTCHR